MVDFATTLAVIELTADLPKLRQIAENADRLGDQARTVAQAARDRITALTGTDGPLAEAFEAVRQIVKTVNTRHNDGRIGVMRDNRGVIGATIELVRTGRGFSFMVAAGHKDKTFEAMVVRFADHFPADIVAIAQTRLAGAQ